MSTVSYSEVSVSDLRPNPFNSNRVSAENEKKIRESIRRNGIFKPIIVRQVEDLDGYEIIGGQHRWEQAVELGMETVPVANLGYITEKQAKEIGLLDNARYGADDAAVLSGILHELGDIHELQTFLPYADVDLTAIFSATDIDLDTLELPAEIDISDENDAEIELPAPKPTKTHTVMRFKVSLADAEAITKLISQVRRDQDFTHEDDLTNAGDALVHVLSTAGHVAATTSTPSVSLDAMLDDIEASRKGE